MTTSMATREAGAGTTRLADTIVRLAVTGASVTGIMALVSSTSLVWLYLSQPLMVVQKASDGSAGALVGLLFLAIRTLATDVARFL